MRTTPGGLGRPRPVVYPVRRRSSLADGLLLSIGLVVVLVAAGIGAVGLVTVASVTPRAADRRREDVDGAVALVQAAGSPIVRAVAAEPNVFGRKTLMVDLTRRAWIAEARTVWCDVVLPTGIGREFVEVRSADGQWRAPTDCTDPTSDPELLSDYGYD